MGNPFLALIVPMGDGAGIGGGQPSHPWVPPGNYPDQGLPPHASHPIVLPGVPDPLPGSPSHPIYVPGSPSHPIYIQGGTPEHPIYIPVYPSQGLPGNQPYPDQGLPGIPGVPTHPWVPPSGETLPPPPDDIVNNYVVAVWNPTKEEWKVQVATGATPK